MEIGDHLYSFAKRYESNKILISNKFEENLKYSMKLKHTNSTTEKLLITKRDNSFIKIFNIIDGDQDGYISRISNNFQKLPDNNLGCC